jgi:hypothetical protein
VKSLRTLVVTLFFLISGFAVGQQDLIDGSVTPNKIPDTVAYRLFFIALSNPSPVQQEQINSIGLGSSDANALTTLLTVFHSKYQAISDQFNSDVEQGSADLASFLIQRSKLVRDTRRAVAGQLSPVGAKLVDAFVQVEKGKMKTTETQ